MSALILCLIILQEVSPSAPEAFRAGNDVAPRLLRICLDDWLCSQTFNYESLQCGFGFSQNQNSMVADDFYSIYEWGLSRIELWALYLESNPEGFLIQIRSDYSGPGSVIGSGSSTYLTHQDTGYAQWGYPLWYTDIFVPSISFPAGKSWLALQTMGAGNNYWLAADQQWSDMSYFSTSNGGSWTSSEVGFGSPCEQFMILNRYTPALERNSWGGIKALF
jgi:hypothetical protein